MAPLMKAAIAGLVAASANAHWDGEHHHHHGEHHHHDGEHHGHHHGEQGGHWGVCPYLKKAVPMGERYLAVAQKIVDTKNSGDCPAFGNLFAENGNFSITCTKRNFTKELHGSAQMQGVCQRLAGHRGKKTLKIKNLFPAFHTGDAIFEVQVMQEDGTEKKTGLFSGHYCPKQQKVMRAKILMGASQDVPAPILAAGESFLRKVEETRDCGAISESVEGTATIEMFGEPGQLAFGDWHHGHHGKEEPATDVASFQTKCEGRVSKEKRVVKWQKLAVNTTYYDATQRELTIIAQKETMVVFKPTSVVKPVAVVLKFSPAGKIEKARFFETEVMHLEAKFATTYGHSEEAEAEAKGGFLERLKHFGRFVAEKAGVAPAEGEQAQTKEFASAWEDKIMKRIESMPEDVKHKKCEWLEKKHPGEWAKGKPWFKAMEKMCAELKTDDELAKLPKEIKQKKCDWFALKRETEWAKEQPWYHSMVKMCSHIQREPLPVAPKPLNGMIVLNEKSETSSARGLFPQVAAMVFGLGLARM